MGNIKFKSQVRLEADILYSAAFKKIIRSSGLTLAVLLRCFQKRKWDELKSGRKKKVVYRDEAFIFPYSEMLELWGIKTTTAWKIIKRLVEVGFLDIEHQGGWYQKHEREKDFSRYKLSERWRKYGTPEFKKVEKERVLPKHFHIRANIARKKSKPTSRKRGCHLHDREVVRPKT